MRVLALWLAAFWLPLTLHCELAGIFGGCAMETCCEDHSGFDNHSCCGEDGQCGTIVCKVLKTGNFRLDDATISIPAAVADCPAFQDFHELQSGPAPVELLDETTGAPPDRLRTWQFVFRAAPAPRAPSARC
jgi:hypothetical protein